MFPQNSNLCLHSELDASTCGEGDTEQITEEGHFLLHGPEFSQSTWRHSAGGDNSDTSIRNPRGGRGRGASQPLCALNVVAPPTHRVHILVDAIVPCGDLNHNRDSLHLMVPIWYNLHILDILDWVLCKYSYIYIHIYKSIFEYEYSTYNLWSVNFTASKI